ncbi:MAG: hypothetical protein ACK52X_07065, partial [bacterium]
IYYLEEPKVKLPFEIAYRELKKRVSEDFTIFERYAHNKLRFYVRVNNLRGEYYCGTKVSTIVHFPIRDPFVSMVRPVKYMKRFDHINIRESAPHNRIEYDKLKYSTRFIRTLSAWIKQLFKCKRAKISYRRLIYEKERVLDYRIVLPEDIIEKVMPFMDKYRFMDVKKTEIYTLFKEAVLIMKDYPNKKRPPVEVLQRLEVIEQRIRVLYGLQEKLQSNARY